MKKYLVLLLGICYVSYCTAQDDEFRTIFRNKDNKHLKISAFGGPLMGFTSVGNDFCHMMGGGGAIMVGNTFFGGYGMGKTNSTAYKNDPSYDLSYGYGGLWMGYVLAPNAPVHLSISGQMGWGAVSKASKYPDGTLENIESQPIFVLTPIAELEFNFSRFFKLGAGVSYNYVTGDGITQTPYTMSELSKPLLFMSFKFGWFH